MFGPFRLDGANARLLREGRPVPMTPKALDVLQFLAERPDQLVTKDELLAAVWPDVIVSDASIKVCVREIRKALEDEARDSQYIQTVHRRGYRFIAPVSRASAAAPQQNREEPAAASFPAALPPALDTTVRHPLVIGRERELSTLADYYARATAGRRQLVFITGGPGSGKTALVETFLRQLHPRGVAATGAPDGPLVLSGSCFEQFGTGEPYLPIWEAVGRAARQFDSPVFRRLAARPAAHAPDPAAPQAAAPGVAATEPRARSQRVLQEITDALESAAAESCVVLVVEDVHWADYSTIDLLSALSRRREPIRMMVIATYRPAEPSLDKHPLRAVVAELATADLCCQLSLETLDEAAVGDYVAARFPGARLPPSFPRRVHQRTDGNPLFLSRLLDDLVEQGVLANTDGTWRLSTGRGDANSAAPAGPDDSGAWVAVLETQVPRTVRAVIEVQLERLDEDEQAALEAGAVAGVEFSAAAAAAALGRDVVQVEQVCDALARRQRFLESSGAVEWPDGTVATHFRFVHDLNHNVVYERIPIAKRSRLHATLGRRLEEAWGTRAAEEAATLATHFEIGRDWQRAVKYLRAAAGGAARQYGHREAADYLRRACAALDRLPPRQREHDELPVLMGLAVNLQVTRGFAAPEVEEVLGRALAICRSAGDEAAGDEPANGAAPRRQPPDSGAAYAVLWGSWVYHKVRSDLHLAEDIARRLIRLARDANDAAMLIQAHQSVAMTHMCLGNPAITVEQMNYAAAVYDARHHSANTLLYGQDPGVATLAFGAVALCIVGRPDEALAASAKAVALSHSVCQPSSQAVALHFAGMLHQLRGAPAEAEQVARAVIELAAEEGFSFWHAGSTVIHGWARAAQGKDPTTAIADIRRGLDDWAATGSRTYRSYYLGLLGDAMLCANEDPAEALAVLDQALATSSELAEGLYAAELHRLRGRCLARLAERDAGRTAESRAALSEALKVAQAQGAQCFERRAAADLAALQDRRPTGKPARAARPIGRTAAPAPMRKR